jgi:hypothetical protein
MLVLDTDKCFPMKQRLAMSNQGRGSRRSAATANKALLRGARKEEELPRQQPAAKGVNERQNHERKRTALGI